MTGFGDEPEHATTLTPAERDGLIPSHIALRSELNELEQQNILAAMTWARSRRRNPVDDAFGRGLHRRMFGKVWRRAGHYRTSDRNIGVPHRQVAVRLRETFDTTRYWIDKASFPPDEIAVRFHHGLVLVHPFPNGNGRWSRLMADLLMISAGGRPLGWGQGSLLRPGDMRSAYIAALRAADRYYFTALIAFAQS